MSGEVGVGNSLENSANEEKESSGGIEIGTWVGGGQLKMKEVMITR